MVRVYSPARDSENLPVMVGRQVFHDDAPPAPERPKKQKNASPASLRGKHIRRPRICPTCGSSVTDEP